MAEQEASVIVAIPSSDDYSWKLSSEKIPHMTLLYLDRASLDSDLERIVQFIQHAADTSVERFGLSVDRRDVLGPDDADVVFFSGHDLKKIEKFRRELLLDHTILQAYNAVTQFPTWTPHLTLGYPTAPAKPDPREYPGVHYVNFDRIALWTKDFSGPEFQLKEHKFVDSELSMSDVIDNVLKHHGVKGMKWGKHTRSTAAVDVTTSQAPGRRVAAKGGENHPAHEDAVRVAANKQLAKKSTTDALSTKSLQEAVNRMNLEQQYRRLNPSSIEKGQASVKAILGLGKTINEVNNFAKSPAGKTLKDSLNK